jgi:hypothetical protein
LARKSPTYKKLLGGANFKNIDKHDAARNAYGSVAVKTRLAASVAPRGMTFLKSPGRSCAESMSAFGGKADIGSAQISD